MDRLDTLKIRQLMTEADEDVANVDFRWDFPLRLEDDGKPAGLEEILAHICGFANSTTGGYIVYGVGEKGGPHEGEIRSALDPSLYDQHLKPVREGVDQFFPNEPEIVDYPVDVDENTVVVIQVSPNPGDLQYSPSRYDLPRVREPDSGELKTASLNEFEAAIKKRVADRQQALAEQREEELRAAYDECLGKLAYYLVGSSRYSTQEWEQLVGNVAAQRANYIGSAPERVKQEILRRIEEEESLQVVGEVVRFSSIRLREYYAAQRLFSVSDREVPTLCENSKWHRELELFTSFCSNPRRVELVIEALLAAERFAMALRCFASMNYSVRLTPKAHNGILGAVATIFPDDDVEVSEQGIVEDGHGETLRAKTVEQALLRIALDRDTAISDAAVDHLLRFRGDTGALALLSTLKDPMSSVRGKTLVNLKQTVGTDACQASKNEIAMTLVNHWAYDEKDEKNRLDLLDLLNDLYDRDAFQQLEHHLAHSEFPSRDDLELGVADWLLARHHREEMSAENRLRVVERTLGRGERLLRELLTAATNIPRDELANAEPVSIQAWGQEIETLELLEAHLEGTDFSELHQCLREEQGELAARYPYVGEREIGEMTAETAQIFLSYASEDRKEVETLYRRLSNEGLSPWMDRKDIVGGEDWQRAIDRAMQQADFIVVCVSANSVRKRGFLQKEIRKARELREEMLESDIYLIPVRLEGCEVTEELKSLHWIDLFDEDGWTRLLEAVRVGMERRQQ